MRECCIGKGGTTWARLNSGGIRSEGARRERHSFGRRGISRSSRDAARRTAREMKAAESFESREVSILNGPIWSKCSIAPTYPSGRSEGSTAKKGFCEENSRVASTRENQKPF